MTEKTKTEHADRTVGGPCSSHQNADKPETHHQGPPDGGARPSGRHGSEAPRHLKD